MILRIAVRREDDGHRRRAIFTVLDPEGANRLRDLGYPADTYVVTSRTESERRMAIAHATAMLTLQIRAAGHDLEE